MVQAQPSYFFERHASDIPYAKARPFRIIVRPPAHACPATLLINAVRPIATARVIAGDYNGGQQSQLEQLPRIIEVADSRVV